MLLRRLKHQGSSIVVSKSHPIDRNCKNLFVKIFFLFKKQLENTSSQTDMNKDYNELSSTDLSEATPLACTVKIEKENHSGNIFGVFLEE